MVQEDQSRHAWLRKNRGILAGLAWACPHAAWALPAPQLAAAAVGLWEVGLLAVAALAIWWPWKSIQLGLTPEQRQIQLWRKRTRRSLAACLVLSLALAWTWTEHPIAETKKGVEATGLVDEDAHYPNMSRSEEQQRSDPFALDVEDIARMMSKQEQAGGGDLVFLDARTPGERQVGSAQGFVHATWPDALAGKLGPLAGKKVIASCWTGMRGSEACANLRAAGVDCRYARGGFKAWVDKGFPYMQEAGHGPDELGTIETFPGVDAFLTASETAKAMAGGAVLIDGRSDYARSKVSNSRALALPFESLRSEEILYRVSSLPSKPVIAICYGHTSCSMASALGWEISKVGGRYVGAYAGGQELLEKAMGQSGGQGKPAVGDDSNPWAMAWPWGLVMGSVLMFASTWMATAARGLAKGSGMSIFAPILSLGVFVLGAAVAGSSGEGVSSMGIQNWASPVGFGLLALASSCASASALWFVWIRRQLSGWTRGESMAAFLALWIALWIALCSSSNAFALALGCASLASMSRHLLAGGLSAWNKSVASRSLRRGWIELGRSGGGVDPSTKAGRLDRLASLGFRVPKGYAVSESAIMDDSAWSDLSKSLKGLSGQLAWRSSAPGEDSATSSMAGLMTTRLGIEQKSWKGAAREVLASYGPRVSNAPDRWVLAQAMVAPKYSGALYTRHPEWGGCMLVEWGVGLGDARMDGSAMAHGSCIERSSGAELSVFGSADKSEELGVELRLDLWREALRIEAEYGSAQDIEWAWDGELLWILQTRPQTALDLDGQPLGLTAVERSRAMALDHFPSGALTLERADAASVLPDPTRLSVDVASRAGRVGGAMNKAGQALGCPQSNSWPALASALGQAWEPRGEGPGMALPSRWRWRMGAKSRNQLAGSYAQWMARSREESQAMAAMDWSKLGAAAWARQWRLALQGWDLAEEWASAFSLAWRMGVLLDEQGADGKSLFYPGADCSHRSWVDYELSAPRFSEMGEHDWKQWRAAMFSKESASSVKKSMLSLTPMGRAERAKHDALAALVPLRMAALDACKRLGDVDVAFWATADEIDKWAGDGFAKDALAAWSEKREVGLAWRASDLPAKLDRRSIAMLGRGALEVEPHVGAVQFVSSAVKMSGRAVEIQAEWNAAQARQAVLDAKMASGGDVIVFAKWMKPEWVGILADLAIGACCESGSKLSHPAALARELSWPMCVGARMPAGAKEGDQVEVEPGHPPRLMV